MCAQWTVSFGSKAGQVSYTMAEPNGPTRLDVLLVCSKDVASRDMERMSRALAEQNIRCFASTLTPLRSPDEPDPLLPWAQNSPGPESGPFPEDPVAALRDLLFRIAGQEAPGPLALVLIGRKEIEAGRILETGLDSETAPATPTILRVAQLHWNANSIREKTDSWTTSTPKTGLLVTEGTHHLEAILKWLRETAVPWLLAQSSDQGGPGV